MLAKYPHLFHFEQCRAIVSGPWAINFVIHQDAYFNFERLSKGQSKNNVNNNEKGKKY